MKSLGPTGTESTYSVAEIANPQSVKICHPNTLKLLLLNRFEANAVGVQWCEICALFPKVRTPDPRLPVEGSAHCGPYFPAGEFYQPVFEGLTTTTTTTIDYD